MLSFPMWLYTAEQNLSLGVSGSLREDCRHASPQPASGACSQHIGRKSWNIEYPILNGECRRKEELCSTPNFVIRHSLFGVRYSIFWPFFLARFDFLHLASFLFLILLILSILSLLLHSPSPWHRGLADLGLTTHKTDAHTPQCCPRVKMLFTERSLNMTRGE